MQQRTHLLGGEEQVVTALVSHQKAETVGMPHHTAGDEITTIDRQISATTIAYDLAVSLHGLQSPAQGLLIDLLFESQNPHQLLEDKRSSLVRYNL